MGRVGLGEEEVDDVEEALEVSVLEVVTDRDEGSGHTRSDTDGVLDIEVGLDTGLAGGLRVGASVEGLERECCGGREVSAEGLQEGGEIRLVRELVNESRDTEDVG